METALDDSYDLHLQSQIFECLREIVYRHDLEYLQSTRSETKMNTFFVRKRLPSIDLFEGLWWVGTRFGHEGQSFPSPEHNTGHDYPWLSV